MLSQLIKYLDKFPSYLKKKFSKWNFVFSDVAFKPKTFQQTIATELFP